MDRQFNRASLILVGSMVRVKLGFSAAKGCSARLSSDLYAGADARVAARGQAGGRGQARACPASHAGEQ